MAPDNREELLEEIRDLQRKLEEAEETLQAIQSGEVDAIVVTSTGGERVYTLKGADDPYRAMVQGMAEGALTLGKDGLILFANEQFACLVGKPLECVMGSHIADFVAESDAAIVSGLLSGSAGRKAEVRLKSESGSIVPVYLSVDTLVLDGVECLCLIVTDLSEQKRNEEIVAAEKLARSILEQAAEAILVVDRDGRISHASRAAEHLSGVPVVHLKFDSVFRIRLTTGEDFPFRRILSAVKRQHSIQNIEATMVSGGRKMDLLLSAARLSSPDSGLCGCVLHLMDITERKHREHQLKFQADILETTAEAVVAIDLDHRVMFWNSGAERLYGIGKTDAMGKPLTDLYRYEWQHPDDEKQAQSALEKQGMWSGENIHVLRDGTRIFVSSNVNAIGQEHGGGMFAVVRDISESKRAEAVLRESEAQERSRAAELEGIMEAVPVAVTIARDPECRHMVGNRMAYKLLGLPYTSNISKSAPEPERPKNWQEVKDGREIPVSELPMQTAARTGQPVHAYEFELAFHDGTSQFWFGNAVPLFDESGRSRGAIGAFVDITERRRADARLQQTQKLESIGLLAGGIAHDFNNLLVGVIGSASLALEMVPPDSGAVEMLRGVIHTGEQLANLTRQMLAYAGKGRFYVERLNLSDLVPEMSRLIQPSIPKKIMLRFDLEKTLPAIEADRGQIHQVFMNLVLNAAEAIGGGVGSIEVKTGSMTIDDEYIRRNPDAAELEAGVYACLQVTDTGCGMDADTRAKVFDPFFSTKFTGRGLGLAAVSGIVRSHKGLIQVESAPGKGSVFTVLLPSVPGTVLAARADNNTAETGSGSILVVDDEQVVREIATKALSRHGYQVLSAHNGLEAIHLAKRHPGDIQLVVLDLSMPGMNGEEVLPELRKVRPGVKVLVSSGYSETETMALFEGQQVCGFIQKPYTSNRLLEKVKTSLDQNGSE
ncbi:MAG TPA: PAS domain S-box protein [Candidatus Sulfopaludibacter sp.]|jgi:PAS domain S-box-containing protein|nr:PAS domain S-box protein [Candidatus Sulfopaludibacter sp.]